MSIDLNWETLTTGPDGLELAHRIRDFIHAKFQTVPLPRFIKSVTVHEFEFGTIPPELELKDITDPLPDFYEENSEADDDDDEEDYDDDDDDGDNNIPDAMTAAGRRKRAEAAAKAEARDGHHMLPHIQTGGGLRNAAHPWDLGSPFLGVSTPGIPGGTSNLSYFHSHLTSGLSGTQTPLAAVAGAHLGNGGWLDHHGGGGGGATPPPHASLNPPSHSRNPSQSSISVADFSTSPPIPGLTPAYPSSATAHPSLREKHSVSTLAPTSAGTSRPPTRDTSMLTGGSAIAEDSDSDDGGSSSPSSADGKTLGGESQRRRRRREPRVEDLQAVFRIRYAGDVKLLLTADILLDYPMPSFVGIPVRLSITGLTFDGVGVLAHIRRRVHFCFLSPEDALAAVGGAVEDPPPLDSDAAEQQQQQQQQQPPPPTGSRRMGGLLQEIRVESEIGQREGGKQSLKNVGKVERFVLEQVRRIFEEEFVYPSFWTFLV